MAEQEDLLILVDSEDRETGLAPKLDVHQRGLLHRAISVCIVDDRGRMLLQRRAREKYHSGGLWTNACCTHPRPKEATQHAAARRLKEELAIDCALHWVLTTHYRAPVSNGLIENEVVHLFLGNYAGEVRPDPREVEAYDWVGSQELRQRIAENPQAYTYWFRHYMDNFASELFLGQAA